MPDDTQTLRLVADLALRLEMADLALSLHPDTQTETMREYTLKQAEPTKETIQQLATRRPQRVDELRAQGLSYTEACYLEYAERRVRQLEYLHHAHGLSPALQDEQAHLTDTIDYMEALCERIR